MASSSEDQLLCSICLDVFKEPVTTPCGHNYCKSCITDYWNSSKPTRCPLCKKRFKQRPALKCNTSFRDMMEQLMSLSVSSSTEEQRARPGDVPCDICLPPKHKALKTCVMCLSSYCPLHLEPHHRVTSLKRHQLIDPTSNLEHRICQKHNKMLELFCTSDQICVCSLCVQDDHASHQCIPLERAFNEEKAPVEHGVAQLKMMENDKTRDINQILLHIEQNKKNRVADLDVVSKGFDTLVDSLRRQRDALVQVIEQKYKDALKPHEDRVSDLKKRLTEIQQSRAVLEKLLQTDDHLQFLLSKPEHPFLQQNEDQRTEFDPDEDISYSSTVKTALTLMESSLSEEMERLIHEVQYSEEEDIGIVDAVWISPKDKLKMIQENYTVDLSLDPYTSYPLLSVFEDNKSLMYLPSYAGIEPTPSSFFTRKFKNMPFVLSTTGFSSSRFYFEVELNAKKWVLGVVRENFNRQITFQRLLSPKDGAWIMSNMDGTGLCHFGCSFANPQKIGVFVDYEKGEVSFYDVDAEVLVSSYRECEFSQSAPLLKSFLYGLVGVRYRTKLYPFFGALDWFDHLKITPVVTSTGLAIGNTESFTN